CAICIRSTNGTRLQQLPRPTTPFRRPRANPSQTKRCAYWKIVGRGLGFAKRNIHLFNDAESAKHLGSVEQIARALCRVGADRKSLIVAVGGGVVGDVAGFAAASYLRGVALVHIPTTLVAQVDSSIGGKTGVNLPEGKNLVGAFYPPRLVITDPDLLGTLADREFRGGLAEVVKHAVISDAPLFARLEKDLDRILRRDREALGSLKIGRAHV